MNYTESKLKNTHVEYHNWDWIGKNLATSALTVEELGEEPLLIFLSSTLDKAPSGISIEHFYNAIQLIAMRHGDLRIYPNMLEMRQDRFKIGDIRALDKIARESHKKILFQADDLLRYLSMRAWR